MKHSAFGPKYSPQEWAAIMDDAKRRAVQARREAVDAFWSSVFHRLAAAWRAARRAAPVPTKRLNASK